MAHGPWHELLLTAAAGLLAGGGALFVLLAFLAGRRAPDLAPPLQAAAPATGEALVARIVGLVAVSLAVGGAVIHLAAAPAHVEELGLAGWGFVAAALFQGAWALSWAISPTRGVALIGIAGSLAIVLGWAWSRTFGLPVGQLAWIPESVGLPDAAATTFELLLVALLAARLAGLEHHFAAAFRRAPSLPVIAAVPAVGMVVVATTLAATFALGHDHAPGSGHEAPAEVLVQGSH